MSNSQLQNIETNIQKTIGKNFSIKIRSRFFDEMTVKINTDEFNFSEKEIELIMDYDNFQNIGFGTVSNAKDESEREKENIYHRLIETVFRKIFESIRLMRDNENDIAPEYSYTNLKNHIISNREY